MPSGAPYDARAVANLLLDLAEERGQRLTQVSLLKLIYFAHGWYLATYDRPLVTQDFEAWQYGPVVKVVRDEFKQFGKSAIAGRATKLNIRTGVRSFIAPDISDPDQNFMRSILQAYEGYDAWQLSDMTHEKGSPWDKLWNTSEPVGRLALRIRNEDIKAHFRGLPRRFLLS